MKANRPNYSEAGRTYTADNCLPLIEAARQGEVVLRALGRVGYPGQRLGSKELPGLQSVGFWDAGPEQGWGLPLHRNEGIELSFLASGQTPVGIEGNFGILNHDELMITRPWQPHRIGNPNIGACKLVWLIIDVGVRRPHQNWQWPSWIVLSQKDRELLTRFLRENEQFIWPAGPEVRRCFLSIAKVLEREDAFGPSRLAVCINELLISMLEAFQSQKIQLRKRLTSAERTVQLFLPELNASLERAWTLEAMAESCRLGVTQFVHYFRTQTNMTPAKYLNHARIQMACELLGKKPGQSITEIGLACGFSSSQYFTNVFRQQLGVSPRAYRASVCTNPK